MKKLIFVLVFAIQLAHAQTQDQKDSLITHMCKIIIDGKNLPDTSNIKAALTTHLYPFLSKYPKEKRLEISESIFFRFQRNCREFGIMLTRLQPQRGDWEVLESKPAIKLSRKPCRALLQHKNHSYLETNGDTVKVDIKKGFWVDHFKDGTYSKLKFEWIGDCEFELTFIESNNNIRENFSKPGDKYRYQVLDKTPTYYEMSAEIVGKNNFVKFRIYF